nr:reverse transcriptase domain-containing protein [Tanacetum cinerariifolium]
MPTPSPSPLISLSPPSAWERLARCTAPAALPSPRLPPPLHMLPPVDRRDDIPETEMPPCKRLCLSTLGSRVTELAELHEYDTQDLYALLEDAQDSKTRISQRVNVNSQRVDLLIEDMIAHQETIQIVELLTLREQSKRIGQPGWDARVPNHQDALRDADKSVLDMIDQALLQNSTNGDRSHSSHEENRKNVQTARLCFYAEFMKCQPLNFKGTEGASKTKTLDETIELDNDLMDQKLHTYVERQSNNKRKADESFRNNQGHFKRDCPKLNNKDGEKVNAPGWVYAVRNAEKRGNASRDPDLDVATGNSYDVELANGKIVEVDTIMQGCTLNFLGHPFNIDLMPVELGSFDIIIGMYWLRRCHAMIVCDEKLVRIPYENETLTFCGNESNNGRESQLTVISCSKAQEYMAKGCQIFLVQISAKKEEDDNSRMYQSFEITLKSFPRTFWFFLQRD